MESERLQPKNEKGRVVPFRPRVELGRSSIKWGNSPVDDLAKYDQGEAEDDYQYRTKMNVLGFLVSFMLMVAGIWVVATLTEMQKIRTAICPGGATVIRLMPPTEPPTIKNHWL